MYYNEQRFHKLGERNMTQLSEYNLTVEDVCAKLGYTPQRVRTLAQEGKLPALKRFRRWMFCEAEIFSTLKNQSPVAGSVKNTGLNSDNGKSDSHPARELLR